MPVASIYDPQMKLDDLSTIKSAGCTAIDITVGDDTPISWDKHLSSAQVLHQEILKQELHCGVIHTGTGIDDIDTIVKAVEVAHALNCEFITVAVPTYDGSVPYRSLLGDSRGCYQDLNQISSETGIDALVPVNAGCICPNADAVMRVLEGLDPSQVGVLFDPDTCSDEADVRRAVDVLGPFLRALSTSKSKPSSALSTALSCMEDTGVFVSVQAAVSDAGSVASAFK